MTFRGDHPDELISASLTGELTDAERAELDAHRARCERCQATLAAFKSERQILSGLPVAGAPRDLSARVRGGIESGRFGGSWWRRPGSQVPLLASAAVFAAVVLSVAYFGHLLPTPVGQASGSPTTTVSSEASSSSVASTAPSAGPSAPPTFLAAGQLGYLELSGASLQPSKLSFINDATGASIDLGTVTGPPIAASLSPDGQWLAYITQKGETGANEVWALHLTDGKVAPLGCSLAVPFTDRLVWSEDSGQLAYTIAAANLGPTAGCPDVGGARGTDAWLFDARVGLPSRFTTTGDAFAASFWPGGNALMVSHAAKTPWTEAIPQVADAPIFGRVDGAFMPLFSPDGTRALFWTGTMASSAGTWQFSRAGMPQLSRDFRSAGPASPWTGTPLFSDLVPVGGEAFAYGNFAWGADSNWIAFWNGAWTGSPQSADGTYPNQNDWYEETVGSLISAASRHGHGPTDQGRIVDVTFGPTNEIAVAIGLPSAGIGDPPSAIVEVIGICCGGEPHTIGGGVSPPLWDGPAVFGH